MNRDELQSNPFAQFKQWYQAAKVKSEDDVDAMALATASKSGVPSVRIVLYKGHTERGFVFYTNYGSPKAHDLDSNPHAALVFYWPKSYRQVRISGDVIRLSHDESDKYFQTRPRDSQLGAWASIQSHVIQEREELIHRFDSMKERFADDNVPCPEFWGGYLLEPKLMEFWEGQPARLHDRFIYTRNGAHWKIERLAP